MAWGLVAVLLPKPDAVTFCANVEALAIANRDALKAAYRALRDLEPPLPWAVLNVRSLRAIKPLAVERRRRRPYVIVAGPHQIREFRELAAELATCIARALKQGPYSAPVLTRTAALVTGIVGVKLEPTDVKKALMARQ